MLNLISIRQGLLIGMVLSCTTSMAMASGPSSGFRLEVGPSIGTSRGTSSSYTSEESTSTTTEGLNEGPSPWSGGGQLKVEVWGLGPIGALLNVSAERAFAFVDLSALTGVNPDYEPYDNDTLRLELAPTFHHFFGPVHVRLAAGGLALLERTSEASLENLAYLGVLTSWDESVSWGGFLELRGDVDLGRFLPFALAQVETEQSKVLKHRNGDPLPDFSALVAANYETQALALELTAGTSIKLSSALSLCPSLTGTFRTTQTRFTSPESDPFAVSYTSKSNRVGFGAGLWLRYEH